MVWESDSHSGRRNDQRQTKGRKVQTEVLNFRRLGHFQQKDYRLAFVSETLALLEVHPMQRIYLVNEPTTKFFTLFNRYLLEGLF